MQFRLSHAVRVGGEYTFRCVAVVFVLCTFGAQIADGAQLTLAEHNQPILMNNEVEIEKCFE